MQTDIIQQGPHFAVGGVLVEALAARDFDRLAKAMEIDATMTALLPRGVRECNGALKVVDAFTTWFGDAETLDVVDASVGQIGSLVQLRWRMRVRDATRGDGPLLIEQHVNARISRRGRVDHMSLLCSGFWPEHPGLSSPSDTIDTRSNPS